MAIAAPLTDIGSSWMRVAAWGLVAMSCIIPGASILVVPFMCFHCGWRKRHLLNPMKEHCEQERMISGDWTSRILECWMWVILFFNVYSASVFVIQSWETFNKGASLRSIVAQMQINQISDILSKGSIMLWRILSIHIIEVSAQVHWHKCEALRRCSEAGENLSEMVELVESFEEAFIDSWKLDHEEHVLDCFRKVSRPVVRCWSIETVVTWISTIGMFSGMLLLKLRLLWADPETQVSRAIVWVDFEIYQQAKSLASPIEGVSWLDLFVIVITATISSWSWRNTISGIFSSTKGMKDNQVQLLLFSLISSGSIELLSAKERKALESTNLKDSPVKDKYIDLKKGSLKSRITQSTEKPNVFDDLLLQKVTCVADIEKWWAVRRYIQIDFKDESAIVDACGAIVFLLLLGLLFSGVVDWSLHTDAFSPGFLLILMLSLVLIFVMFRVFEECIGINNILDRDTLLLTETMLTAVHIKSKIERPKVIAAPQAIALRLSAYDDKQKLLGITVSANLRNGWIASLIVTAFSWGSRFMTPVLSQLDVDNLQQLILNSTEFVRRGRSGE
ncbi:unnamed protein product [Effrenium voratum]|nr:unnamed protein product [Effrenium voratum]